MIKYVIKILNSILRFEIKKHKIWFFLINTSPVEMDSFKSPVNSSIIKNYSTIIDFVLSDKQTKILKLF